MQKQLLLVTAAVALSACKPSPYHPIDKDWRLVWDDEFIGASIDPAKWGFEQNCWGGGNNEQQCYTDRPVNAYVKDGALHIRAQREDFTGSAETEDSAAYDPNVTRTLPYTSARLRSLHKGDWTYGRIEVRAKLPQGQGTWPAIWMLPSDYEYGGWAASGEIDIMEAVNLKAQSDAEGAEPGQPESRVHGTLHYGRAWPENVYSGTAYDMAGDNPADDFHHYALEWEEGEIRWYVDGVHYATQTQDDWYTQYINAEGEMVNGEAAAPFNRDFHLLLNLAVGGNWAGTVNETGIDESVFPQEMVVDFVRVYQCDVDPLTGLGCATRSPDAEDVVGNEPPEIIPPVDDFGAGPLFLLFDGELSPGLVWNAYDPDGVITATARSENGDAYLNINKAGANGNFYATYAPRADLSHWADDGDLLFELRVNSRASDAQLRVKLDSGWPNVSDLPVELPPLGQWQTVRLNIAQLVAAGNSIVTGQADLADILNPIVFEPSGAMDVDIDDIRYQQSDD
ncbi:glycoside hydrolase family 16 protein [Saccharospirillum mangrovi]|uniref:glycoside hydrolase family 16 protein n=1 Tax=Saccharospirillum mangrovi TaxID=2161747 RepID=UPI000D349D74|nr:glycoside hydrolase family 16 protein [Saccharospirillum mangrovi]